MISAVETDPGTPGNDGTGRRGTYEWRSRVPYPVRFAVEVTRVARPSLLAGRASGELAGTGTWRFFEHSGMTAVVYEWDVATTKAWMNVIGPLAAPVFEWNHDWIMRRGGEGLAARLGVRLLAAG